MKWCWFGLIVFMSFGTVATSQSPLREKVYQRQHSNGEWVNWSRTVYIQTNESFEKEKNYLWSEGAWRLRSADTFRRNKAGNVTYYHSVIYSDDFDRILLESTQTSEYLSDTLLIKSSFIRKSYEEEIGVFVSETIKSYTQAGLVEREENRNRETVNGPWFGNLIQNAYDANGCLVEVTTSELVNSDTWIPRSRLVIERDNLCRETLQITYRIENGAETESSGRLTTYSDSPNERRITVYRRFSPENAWQVYNERVILVKGDSLFNTRTFYEQSFDTRRTTVYLDNKLVRELSEIRYTLDFVPTFEKFLTYENGILVGEQWEERSADDENRLVSHGYNQLEFNDAGQLIRKVSRSYYATYNSHFTNEYFYDCAGQLSHEINTTSFNDVYEYDRTDYKYYLDPPCDPLDFEDLLVLYPNPATDEIWIYSQTELSGARVDIIDMTGKILISKSPESGSYFPVNVSNLSQGIYLLRMKGADYEITKRFVKTNN